MNNSIATEVRRVLLRRDSLLLLLVLVSALALLVSVLSLSRTCQAGPIVVDREGRSTPLHKAAPFYQKHTKRALTALLTRTDGRFADPELVADYFLVDAFAAAKRLLASDEAEFPMTGFAQEVEIGEITIHIGGDPRNAVAACQTVLTRSGLFSGKTIRQKLRSTITFTLRADSLFQEYDRPPVCILQFSYDPPVPL